MRLSLRPVVLHSITHFHLATSSRKEPGTKVNGKPTRGKRTELSGKEMRFPKWRVPMECGMNV